MKKLDIILTLDYELYGNGSGDIFSHLVNPTDKLLKICDQHNIKLTIFFEVIEYLKIKEEWEKGNDMGYELNPVIAIENQIKTAFQNGHDIQLHIHPQWVNAKYSEKKGWVVDNRWRLKDIPKNGNGLNNLKTLIIEGKRTLEKLLRPIDNKYSCFIFRAGGFNILPSEIIFPELKTAGLKVDSSVYAGGFEINTYSNIDFRNLKNTIPYWGVNKDIYNQSIAIDNDTIVEFPIFAIPVLRLFKYDFIRIKSIIKNRKSSLETLVNRIETKSMFSKIMFFFEKEYITWDFCLFNYSKMKKFYSLAKSLADNSKYKFHPFVLIGHSKGFFSPKPFNKFVANYKNKTNFITLKEAYRIVKSNG